MRELNVFVLVEDEIYFVNLFNIRILSNYTNMRISVLPHINPMKNKQKELFALKPPY